MAYDRADWHYGGDFPEGLPPENGGTHIGMFLAWAVLNGLIGEFHLAESAESMARVKAREMTGRDFLIKECDQKFWEEDLNEEGNAFARSYYDDQYFGDYETALGGDLPSLYHVEDTWENYDAVAPLISRAYAKWKNAAAIKWWQFWR